MPDTNESIKMFRHISSTKKQKRPNPLTDKGVFRKIRMPSFAKAMEGNVARRGIFYKTLVIWYINYGFYIFYL